MVSKKEIMIRKNFMQLRFTNIENKELVVSAL